MRPFTFGQSTTPGYGELLEKIEILRSTLRWATRLEREEIRRLLGQCNALREDVMSLSRRERFVQSSAALEDLRAPPPEQAPTAEQRRAALLEREFTFDGVFGDNPKLLETLEIAEKAAPTDLPVLVRGESGTGKELLAKVVHTNGRRSQGPFVSVNCGAIPENLVESELFGHKKGAFTGAASDRKGKFESANLGTIFLDEIGELPLSGQVKLLRVLQSQEIQRVGSDSPIKIDARIVAATNRDLLAMVQAGQFREDLYYRLSVIEVTVPPLRERRDEIPLLIDFFCDAAAERLGRSPLRLSPRLRQFLLDYGFPGNIRELHNLIFRMSCLAGDTADLPHLPDALRSNPPSIRPATDAPLESEAPLSLGEVKKTAGDAAEKRFLEQGLREVNGRAVELARRQGMNRSHLQTLLKKHGLSAKAFRPKKA
ncbi:MAG: sigma 54-interacting transcriptional regulator [Candidatus Competibacter sp.]|nr:sigma 54-interacting transcriptional regulator [Candidatus Competibacter sp.]MDG4582883.1 sigma 54-interacting transcriptional regulator [Candidatus Competibacter sp.]